ncbi:universal stress protein [Psychromarinibacter halotolerans]|uniref:Universal stress protein n=1 Tax=Psychromarinibacter halotolerans TaxID=1775175 RepID=A0ABV7GR94_9RHOB|nr:universal stress protein [Psychromarinibacter halotolerans]MAQ86095.1 universal stress protein [Maritimibacter sp.]MDF0596772.1 universal stress protein [Psychromarinibacter halotolerans]
MTTETFVVAYECEEDSSSVLAYAIARAQKDGALLHLVHVLEWSPYTFLTPQEIEERTTRRKQEMTRAQEAIIDPALAKARAAGVEANGEIRFGQVVEIISETATKLNADMIIVGRSGSNSVAARVFGSVPLGLAQIAKVPTVIVP